MRLAWAGVSGQPVTSAIAASLGLARPGGVLIKDVYPGGPLANAGVKSGDVVQAVNGTPVNDVQALNYRIATHAPGARVRVAVASGKATRDVMATVALPPENPPRETQTIAGRNPLSGAKVENLSPAVALDLGADLFAKGIAVTKVPDNSLAAAQGFRPGDIIRGINGVEVDSTGELVRALNAATRWQVTLERGGRRITASFAG